MLDQSDAGTPNRPPMQMECKRLPRDLRHRKARNSGVKGFAKLRRRLVARLSNFRVSSLRAVAPRRRYGVFTAATDLISVQKGGRADPLPRASLSSCRKD